MQAYSYTSFISVLCTGCIQEFSLAETRGEREARVLGFWGFCPQKGSGAELWLRAEGRIKPLQLKAF